MTGDDMPFPLAIPFLIKGAVVAAKFIASKHAAASAGKAVILATKTYGVATTAGTVATGLVVVGGIHWSIERIDMGKKALRLFDNGDYRGAAEQLATIASSFYKVEGADLITEIKDWIAAGGAITDPAFKDIISDLRDLVDEANMTRARLQPA